MKKIILASLAIGTALCATPAFAQSASGLVTVGGTVASKCTAAAGNLNETITLGELANSSGTVASDFPANSGGLSRSYTVKCTSGAPHISVDASPLVNSAITTATTGYTKTVHYTATLTAVRAVGAPVQAADTSNATGATTAAVGSHLANAANNVTIAISNGNTTTATDLLEAGSYSGSIAIIVSPTAFPAAPPA
jgi:hypothetical protein